VLPRLLALLREHRLRATFFVEGVNAESYPDALRSIAAGGHELGLHAWRHEQWDQIAPEREGELIERGARALEDVAARPLGFRPPGGRLTVRSAELLRRHGFAYASPLAADRQEGIARLPFEWEHVDAFHLYPGTLRARMTGEAEGSAGDALPARVRAGLFRGLTAAGTLRGAGRMRKALRDAVETPEPSGHRVLIMHPFLLERERAFAAASDVLARTAELRDAGRLDVLTMAQAAGS